MTKQPSDKEGLEYRGPIRHSLPDVPEILEQYDVLRAISIQKSEQEGEIIQMIQKFQSECSHEHWEEVRSLCARTFLGWKCVLCKVFKPKPEGPPWKICTECGAKMVFSHIYDEQKISVYRCSNCGHKEEVT